MLSSRLLILRNVHYPFSSYLTCIAKLFKKKSQLARTEEESAGYMEMILFEC